MQHHEGLDFWESLITLPRCWRRGNEIFLFFFPCARRPHWYSFSLTSVDAVFLFLKSQIFGFFFSLFVGRMSDTVSRFRRPTRVLSLTHGPAHIQQHIPNLPTLPGS